MHIELAATRMTKHTGDCKLSCEVGYRVSCGIGPKAQMQHLWLVFERPAEWCLLPVNHCWPVALPAAQSNQAMQPMPPALPLGELVPQLSTLDEVACELACC